MTLPAAGTHCAHQKNGNKNKSALKESLSYPFIDMVHIDVAISNFYGEAAISPPPIPLGASCRASADSDLIQSAGGGRAFEAMTFGWESFPKEEQWLNFARKPRPVRGTGSGK